MLEIAISLPENRKGINQGNDIVWQKSLPDREDVSDRLISSHYHGLVQSGLMQKQLLAQITRGILNEGKRL